jgi:hypothetical protein
MTEQEQRIAIAEVRGWYDIGEPTWNRRVLGRLGQGPLRNIPDYPQDLNAMHEAEKVLTEKHVRSYAFILAQVLDTIPTVDLDDQFLNIHATAAQRAEAFLRTFNLWKP